MDPAIARSYLYVPASRPDRFDKALASGADAVIVDLEDAVPAGEKVAARNALAQWLTPAKPVIVRVNAANSQWFRDDLEVCRNDGVAGIILPKAEALDEELIDICTRGGKQLLPLIETAIGLVLAQTIACGPGVQRLLFGTIDFQLELGIDGDGDELLYFRSQLVLASRLAGVQPPVDGPCTTFDDDTQVSAHAQRARRVGFGGVLCIHPKQVASVNAAFTPSAEQVVWAQRVLDATARSAGAAIALDGRMIDRPVILKAEQVIREDQRRAARS